MALQVKTGMRIFKRSSSAGTKVIEEAGGGDVQGVRAEIPLEPAVKIVGEVGGWHWSRDPPAASGGPHTKAGGCMKEARPVTPWGTHAGALSS